MIMRFRWCGWLAAVVCLCAGAVARGQGPAVEEAFQRGAVAMRNGRSADAEAAFRSAVKLAPGMAEAHLDLGLVLGREGKLTEAIGSIQRALELDPKLPSAHMFLGIFLSQANRPQEAMAALKEEIAADPKNVEALTWLGTVEMGAGDAGAAAEAFDRAVELKPNDLDILELRGKAHSLVARDSYAKMARIDPSSWHVHRVKGNLFAEGERHSEAIEEYKAAIALEGRNPDLYEALGDECRKANRLEEARDAYKKELELTPGNLIAMYDLGSTEVELGETTVGIPLLQTMLKTYQHAPVAEYYVGRALAVEGKDAEAAGWLERSAAEDPAGEVGKRSNYELARVYRKLQRKEDADRALAAYDRMRQAQERQNAAKIEDWRKLGEGAPVGQSAPQ